MVAKVGASSIERFRINKGRVTDYYEHNADTIRAKKTVMATAKIFAEMTWLVNEIKRLGGEKLVDEPDRFAKIAAFVARVARDQAGAIATGQFVKVRADVFGAWRYLVRALESVFKLVLETEDALLLGGDKMPDEHSDRITLDLEEGLGDDDVE